MAIPAELGFDPVTDAIIRRLKQQQDRDRASRGEDEANITATYGEQQRRLEQERPKALEGVLDSFAGRGMAHSGKYLQTAGDTERQFNDRGNDIARSRANAHSSLNRAYADKDANYEDQRQAAIADLARRRAVEAEDFERRRQYEQPQQVQLPTPVAPPVEVPGGYPAGSEYAPANPVQSQGETQAQREARILQEVLSGSRDLNSVRASVDRLAGRAVGDYSAPNNDASFLGNPDALARRIAEIFRNRGVGY